MNKTLCTQPSKFSTSSVSAVHRLLGLFGSYDTDDVKTWGFNEFNTVFIHNAGQMQYEKAKHLLQQSFL